jgi:hypothetical protein
VEIDEEAGHGVEEPIAVRVRAGREPSEEAAVLEGVGEVASHEDGGVALDGLGEADRLDGRKLEALEVTEYLVLATGDLEGFFLQGEERPVDDEEANEMPRGADGEGPKGELLGRPVGERPFPGELQEAPGRRAEAEAREPRRGGSAARGVPGQSRLRRYVVAVGS